MPGLLSRAAAVPLKSSTGCREGWTQPRDVHGYTVCISSPHFGGVGSDVRLTQAIIAWCREQGFGWVYLHASNLGRPLYESRVQAIQRNAAQTVIGNSCDSVHQILSSVLNSSKSQVNACLSDIRFFWNFMLKILLRRSRHDQHAAMWQSFRKSHSPFGLFSRNNLCAPKLTEAITGSISGSASECSPTLSFPFR